MFEVIDMLNTGAHGQKYHTVHCNYYASTKNKIKPFFKKRSLCAEDIVAGQMRKAGP